MLLGCKTEPDDCGRRFDIALVISRLRSRFGFGMAGEFVTDFRGVAILLRWTVMLSLICVSDQDAKSWDRGAILLLLWIVGFVSGKQSNRWKLESP